MKYNSILSVFRTYCDCYLEYVNNFVSGETFCEFYNIDPCDWLNVVKAVKMTQEQGGRGIYHQAVKNYAYRMARNGRYNDLQPLCR